MQLIDRIEVNYFRSVYSVSVKKLRDLNVFLGPNDAGKSNILRALNLFFNNESGYDEDIQFLQDVTHLRQQEARDAKGRLTIWIKVHFNNVEKWKTLPQKFYIKKSWNRYSDDPEITSDVENQQSLTRFQNKIRFHYVPAVKEKDIFSDYLNLLYETLSDREDIEFSGPADALSSAVNASITDLTDRIKVALAVNSNIQIPNDLESIFERLEFFTDQDNFRVPLSRRGDGLQVRHIPHILRYISANNRSLNIWAYEEPENSLEMSNAFSLAEEFEKEFAGKNQIFITSHSPAFYSIKGERARHYLVKKAVIESSGSSNWITSVSDLADTKVADTELGVAQLVADRSREAFDEIKRLKEKNDELSALAKSVILTEGKTDAALLNGAWKKLYPDETQPFEIKSCDLGGVSGAQECAGAGELRKILESTTKDQTPVRVCLFDRDTEGLGCFDRLKKHVFVTGKEDWKVNRNGMSGAIMLPDNQWGSPYDDYIHEGMCIEMMFPYKNFSQEDVKFEFFVGSKKIKESHGLKCIDKFSSEPDLFETIQLRVVPKFQNKVLLSNKLLALEASEFHSFKSLFENTRSLLGKIS